MNYKLYLIPALLSVSLLPSVSAAQGVNLASGFTDFSTWNLYGKAVTENFTPGNGFTYSQLQLTQPIGDSAGAGFAPAAISLDFNQAFNFDFNFFIRPGIVLMGDGLTLTLAGTPGVGGGGSDLGYAGLGSDSVAFAIDTFSCCTDVNVAPSLEILQSGSASPVAFSDTGLGNSISDQALQWYATLDYTPSGLGDNAGVLTGTIQRPDLGNFTVSANVDFAALNMVGNPVFYGFTASNGLADDGHIVTSAAPAAVPVPAAVWLFGSAIAGFRLFGKSRKK